MRLTAAYRLPPGSEKPTVQPDQEFEVDDAEGERLLRDGWARLPDSVTGAKDMAAPKKGESDPQYKVVGGHSAPASTPRGAAKGGDS